MTTKIWSNEARARVPGTAAGTMLAILLVAASAGAAQQAESEWAYPGLNGLGPQSFKNIGY